MLWSQEPFKVDIAENKIQINDGRYKGAGPKIFKVDFDGEDGVLEGQKCIPFSCRHSSKVSGNLKK